MRQLAFLLLLAGVACAQPRITGVFQEGNTFLPGIAASSAIVEVTGTGFNSLMRVTVGGINAAVFSYSPTDIQMRLPAGSAGTTAVSASVVVTTSAGSSAAFTLTIVPQYPTIVQINPGNPPGNFYFFRQANCCAPNPLPVPGDVVYMYVNGLGDTPANSGLTMSIDDQQYPLLGIGAGTIGFGGGAGFTCGPAGSGPFCANARTVISFKVPDTQPGHHRLYIQAGSQSSQPITFDLNYSGIITSQSGLFYGAVQGGPAPLAQSFSVLSGIGTINFNLDVSTTSGGNWLQIDKQNGSAQAGSIGVPIKVSVNPAGLAAGAYYGSIQVSADRVLNSPQTVTVVLRVLPTGTPLGPYLDSSGLIFLATQGAAPPSTQTVTISNASTSPVTFTPSLPTGTQFKFSPASGTIASGQTGVLSIDGLTTGVAAGVYTARVNIAFSDGSTRAVSLLLVIAPNGPAKTGALLGAGGCAPTKLLPVFSQPGASFNVSAAWPTPIIVRIADDCAVPLTTGTVGVTFSNGDPLLPLASGRDGSWTGTWAAVRPLTSGVNITVNASDPASGLTGSASLTGGVAANPDAPIVNQGGVIDAASYGPALSPGAFVVVQGSKLATPGLSIASAVPLPMTLGTTTVLVGNKRIPMYYTADVTGGQQLAGILPYDLPQNTSLQMVVRNGNAISSPQPVLLVPARPAIFTVDSSGRGQGHIYWYDDASNQIRAEPKTPAKPGDTVVVYCMGLGAVDPPVQAGAASSLTTLSQAINPVTANVGGRNASVSFAGVTPGSAGLYQVNLTIPSGLPDNDFTFLVLSSNGQDSVAVTLAVRTPK